MLRISLIRITRLLAAAAAGSLFALFPAAASARPDPSAFPLSATSAHFVVHYSLATSTATEAQQVANDAERAYSLYVGKWGYPAPIDDGDGHTDVYMVRSAGGASSTIPDRAGTQTPAYVALDGARAKDNPWLIAHEFFHVVQFAMYAYSPEWEVEGSAAWAGGQVVGSGYSGNYGDWSTPLDCRPAGCDNAHARARDQFFEFLSERFGTHLVAEAYLDANAIALTQHAFEPFDISSLDQALAAHGSSLSTAFHQFAVATLWGDFTVPGLRGARTASYMMPVVQVPSASAALPDQTASVDHLAVRYISYRAQEGAGAKSCAPGTLHLQIAFPPGAGTQPAVSVDGRAPLNLSVSGATASVTTPWSTCDSEVIVALPNASTSADGAQFSVHATVSVAAIPPPVVRASIPAVVRLTRSGKLTLSVSASNPGRLQIDVRSKRYRATVKLVRGQNRVSMTLPRALRTGRHRLTLTPFSLTGRRGSAVARTVRIRTP